MPWMYWHLFGINVFPTVSWVPQKTLSYIIAQIELYKRHFLVSAVYLVRTESILFLVLLVFQNVRENGKHSHRLYYKYSYKQ